MSEKVVFNPEQRLTRAKKNRDGKKWFKEQINMLDKISFSRGGIFGVSTDGMQGVSEYRKMKINYDLFNNILNKADFETCYPFIKNFGELPVDFTNKDIISGKIKAVLGLEMKRPFPWKVLATNKEATTRKEQEEFGRFREFVINSIIQPIKERIELQAAEQAQGQQLTAEQQQQIQQQIAEELKAQTPEEVKKYMHREHQDPAEVLATQLLEYLIQKEDIQMKFNKAWKHACISGKEIFWTGIVAGEPVVKVVNPLFFDYDKSKEEEYIEDGEWACYEMYMLPSEIHKYFSTELSTVELDEIYESYSKSETIPDASFSFRQDGFQSMVGIRVLHCEWKSLKPVKFVSGIDPMTGEEYLDMVDETYKFNPEAGDLEISTEWITTKYEGYKIGEDKFAFLREVPGQNKDLDNLHVCKLSYIGAVYDDTNSEPTSLIDRMKYYQYMYNILVYKIEELISSDEGKKILLNGNLIPKNSGMEIEQWLYFFKVNNIGIMDPTEEGNKGNPNMGEAAKEIDMSLVSDITKYMQLAEYIEKRCGEVVGITKQVEGQIQEREAVRNTQIALGQSANILEPYFEVHNNVKRNVLQSLIEVAKVAYSQSEKDFISYVLDDMSTQLLKIDKGLLDNSSYGLFVSNTMKAYESMELVKQLSHAAMQNQLIELSDVLTVSNSNSIQEAQEMLKVAETERKERESQMQQQQLQAQQEMAKAQQDWEREKMDIEHSNTLEEIELKGKIDLQKQAMLSVGFNEDKDLDKDGMPDVLEIYKAGVDAQIKQRKQELDESKLEQQKKEHEDKTKLEERKIKAQIAKSRVTSK